jgi:hypothetical protein
MLAPVQWKQCQNRIYITQTCTGASHTGTSASKGLVPIWDYKAIVQFQHWMSGSSTGCPVPALGKTNYHFSAQFQHWAPHVGTVSAWGHQRPSSSTGWKISPSSSTGPVPIWGLTFIRGAWGWRKNNSHFSHIQNLQFGLFYGYADGRWHLVVEFLTNIFILVPTCKSQKSVARDFLIVRPKFGFAS